MNNEILLGRSVLLICLKSKVFAQIFPFKTRIKPSTACGPYKDYDTSYQVITDVIDKWKADNDIVEEAFSFVSSPGFISGLLILLG